MCANLAYPSFPLIGVDGAVSLVITLPGPREPKAHIVAPGGGVGATFPITPEVALQSQRSFEPAAMEVACLGCCWRGGGWWLRPGPTKAWACSGGGR